MFHLVKKTMALKITKKQYAHLIREISDALKSNISGGGMYDFAAPEVYEHHPMSQVQFWVADDEMDGGGFFSSIGKAFKSVYSALKNSGVVDKAKDAALKKGRELGGQAIPCAIYKTAGVLQGSTRELGSRLDRARGRSPPGVQALHDGPQLFDDRSILHRGSIDRECTQVIRYVRKPVYPLF